MQCRICGAGEVDELGTVEYYSGFAWTIFDCRACSCRFTRHEESIYNHLHSTSSSIYGLYRDLAESIKPLFDRGDAAELKRELSKAAKYRFVIESVGQQPRGSKLLEVGCARGYLTSCFILDGYDIRGCDVSPEAVAGARGAFGDHFVTADSKAIVEHAPYDLIYHVGTIGCVGDPLGLTSDLLTKLKPGGQLLFNAPNADSCGLREQLWIDAAPPPDLVTLFRPGFWRKQFSDVAEVVEEVEMCSPDGAFEIGVRKLFRRKWQRPMPSALDASAKDYQRGRFPEHGDRIWTTFERGLMRLSQSVHLSRFAPRQPSPFGLFVTLTKK